MSDAKWTDVNKDSDPKWCDMAVCDFEAVGYAIATDGTRFCLCETCRAAFYLGAEVAAQYGVPDFFRFSAVDDDEEEDGDLKMYDYDKEGKDE